MALLYLKLAEGHLVVATQRLLLFVRDSVLTLTFLQHGEGDGYHTHVAMFATLCGRVKVNFNLPLNIIT